MDKIQGRRDALYFGEDPSRIIISLRPDHLEEMERLCSRNKLPLHPIGYVGGDEFIVDADIHIKLETAVEVWQTGLSKTLADDRDRG